MAMTMAQMTNNVRWGDIDEYEAENLDFLLPPRQVIGPDADGIKKVIDYSYNDEGNQVKITTTTRVRKIPSSHLSKRAIEHRSWNKFGDAVHQDVGARLTVVSTEEIALERRPRDSEESKNTESNNGAVLMVCRSCGKKGEHWTAMCPYTDLEASSVAAPSTSTNGAYVPPRPTTDARRRNVDNCVRVSNLSEDTREADLYELFSPFGDITRVRVAYDKNTGLSRGFGFVTFARREFAEKAINKLNGYGYDSLILMVDWDSPRN